MSSGKNTIVRSIAPKSVFPSAKNVISSAVSFNQGDLLVFDATNKLLKIPAAEAEGSTFLGVAADTIVAGLKKSPYTTDVDASAAISDIPGPIAGVIAKCVLKTGSTLASGGSVFLDPATGTRGVAATGTKDIGVYQGPAIAGSAAGLEIEVFLGYRYPDDTLRF